MPDFRCASCGKIHSIADESARAHCLKLMDRLKLCGSLDFEHPGSETDQRLSTLPLFGEGRGQMFGILVCAPPIPGGQEIILKAFSGQFNGIWEIPGWAPPLLDPAIFDAAVKLADPAIKALSTEIDARSPGIERRTLIEKRRILSQLHMREIHDMYTIRNFKDETTSLFALFSGRIGIPAGTGDCCAPKLLNYASLHGLKPLSLAEFFWGRENRSATKQHRGFYAPCNDKCAPILGYMLCGADNED
ncbi:MAG: hypothetical protein JEZ04_16550 [Spirochaetales bacterium]|nr:hypothetical protein [Spirochaetales bacterium]